MTIASFDDLGIGDRVWCLAAVGTPFVVAELDPARRVTVVAQRPAGGSGGRIDLTVGSLWLLTKEPWDQIWYWPDRAGETFETVVGRFAASHQPGQVVRGYYLDTGVGASNQGFVRPNPKTAMSFQVEPPVAGLGQVRVRPVAETPDGVIPVGPNVPLRVGMVHYRWSLSFGELVVNWEDFLRPSTG